MKKLLLLTLLAILGCSSEPDQEGEQGVLLDSAKAPLEKAEAVEGIVLESKERIDEAVETGEE
ncbi:MAG: hypothetical protein OEQ30_05500 [Gammaproteobacteria bacterium]|jgi:uncharacterized protein YcfL|nr:hypothetical protein [Gammaproteobacteria bacterium]MDH3758280.1 hypothetical protein [Gammaproteobacteria bacterium]MDH3848780.1 hypothetical protein [Gammaproteobacteria bacterium]MDH3864722.1 hypothetical protein [Gammaproteobacteria bacterium]MDH3904144.1 hypothetical protein [Gammaproteobacteria bacterium]